MSHQPVHSGESRRDKLTATWFNRLLPVVPSSASGGKVSVLDTLDRIPAFVDQYSSGVTAYRPIAVSNLFHRLDHEETACLVSTEEYDATADNWVIVQQDAQPESTILIVVHGLTRAFINMIEPGQKYCKYNPATKQLDSTDKPAKGHILDPGDADHPGLIIIDYDREGTSSSGSGSIKYRIDYAQPDKSGIWFCTALIVPGGTAHNPDDVDNPIIPGSSFRVHDPNNHFPAPLEHLSIPLEWRQSRNMTGSIGYCHLRTGENSGLETELWEIQNSSLPVQKIKLWIDECLTQLDSNITGHFRLAEVEKMSSYPYVDTPRGADISDLPTWDGQLTVANPLRITAVKDSYIWVEIDDNAEFSQTSLQTPHGVGIQTGNVEYYIVNTEKPIARWAKVKKSGGVWGYKTPPPSPNSDFKEGFNPTTFYPACAPSVSGAASCTEDINEAWAFYNPEDHEYVAISSESALLGPPNTVNVVTNILWEPGCVLMEYKATINAFCITGLPAVPRPIPLISTPVVTQVWAAGSSICVSTSEIFICDIAPADSYCIDICPLLCECPEFYSLPETCEPPPCYNSPCTYTWDGDSWNLTTPCPQDCKCADPPPPPGPGDPYEVTTQCQDDPPCEPTCLDCTPPGSHLRLVSLLHTDNAPRPGYGCTAQASFSLGDVISNEGCTIKHAGMWNCGGAGIPVEVTVTRAGTSWLVSFSDGPAHTLDYIYAGTADCNFAGNIALDVGESASINIEVVCTAPAQLLLTSNNQQLPTSSSPPEITESPVPTRPARSSTANKLKGPTPPTMPYVPGLGDAFARANSDWFRGCGCKKDVIAVMNKWDPHSVSDKSLDAISRTIASKNKGLDLLAIQLVIRAFLEKYNNA